MDFVEALAHCLQPGATFSADALKKLGQEPLSGPNVVAAMSASIQFAQYAQTHLDVSHALAALEPLLSGLHAQLVAHAQEDVARTAELEGAWNVEARKLAASQAAQGPGEKPKVALRGVGFRK